MRRAHSIGIDHQIVAAFLEAAEDLGIRVTAPFLFLAKTGGVCGVKPSFLTSGRRGECWWEAATPCSLLALACRMSVDIRT
jgi:hypothetical protein